MRLWICLVLAWAGSAAAAPAGVTSALSDAVQQFAERVRDHADHGRLPFAIVDKNSALLAVYRGDGTLAGTTPVLLGSAVGDRSQPGVGERAQSGHLLPADRTTPAGRYASSPGRNHAGEAVVWVDYGAAFAIHRLRADAAAGLRLRRLASTRSGDHRVSAGCVVVPVDFYETIVQPLLGQRRGVVYVLPEQGPWQGLWDEIVGLRRSL